MSDIAVFDCMIFVQAERHLTYLMRKDTPAGQEFCARFPDLKILPPPAFLHEIAASK